MKISTFLLFLASPLLLLSQNFNKTAEFTLGGDQLELMTPIPHPNGTSLYFVGTSASGTSGIKTEPSRGNNDCWIVKTDLNYNVLWDKTLGGSGIEEETIGRFIGNELYISCISNSPISGDKTVDSIGGKDVWIIKLDTAGTILWQSVYGGNSNESYNDLDEINGNIVLGCATNSSSSGDISGINHGFLDSWVAIIDHNSGAVISERILGSTSNDILQNLDVINNRIFVQITGLIGGDGDIPPLSPNFDTDIVIIELDQNLLTQNTKRFWGDADEYPVQMLYKQNTNEIFLIASSGSGISGNKTSICHSPGIPDYWVLKLDHNLNVLWDNSFGGSNVEFIGLNSGVIDNNGRVVISGSSRSPISGNRTATKYGIQDLWGVVINPTTGDPITDFSFGGSGYEYSSGILQLNQSGKYLLTSNSDSPVSGNKGVGNYGDFDCWVVEVDGSDFLAIEEQVETPITVFPNPTSDVITFGANEVITNITLFNSSGQKISLQFSEENPFERTIDLSSLSAGTYYVKLQTATSNYRDMVIKE